MTRRLPLAIALTVAAAAALTSAQVGQRPAEPAATTPPPENDRTLRKLSAWREEIVTFSNGELRIYGTSWPAADRRVTLMRDRLYRNDVTHRAMGYPHVPMTSYFLGVKRRGAN